MGTLLAIAYGFSLLWGALWGSFLNVVVYRVPAGLSVVHPRSRCPNCLAPITWWQNIPVLSYALLGGRCASCKNPISLRYPLVEAVTAALSLAVFAAWFPLLLGDTEEPWRVFAIILAEQAFVFVLLAIALIDADTFTVPDVLSLPLPLLGLGLAFVGGPLRDVDWQQSAAAALVAGGGLLAVQWGYAALTGREGLGTGDVKLLAGIGAFLGLRALPVVLLLGALQGLGFALAYARLSRGAVEARGLQSVRHLAIPFGPFLSLAALQWLLLHRLFDRAVAAWLGG